MDVKGEPVGAGTMRLDHLALEAVLSHLDWRDLLAASASCRQLREAAAAPHLWSRLCHRRWGGSLNLHLSGSSAHPAGPGLQSATQQSAPTGPAGGTRSETAVNYRALFLQDNGWASPHLKVQQYAGVRWADEIVAVHPHTAEDGTATIAVSSCHELRVLQLGTAPRARLRVLRAANHSVHSRRELWSSILPLDTTPASSGGGTAGEGWVAVGGCHGRLAVFQLPESSSTSPSQMAAQPAATLNFPNSCLVSDLQYLPAQQHLVVLHDPLALLRPTPQRSMLSVVDVASWRQVSPAMQDVLDGYELAAVVGTAESGCEFVAGSVKLSDDQASGWACQRCYAAAPAALCFHKSPAASAALCLFDCRAAQAMVARYSTHHRSLYPHLEAVRGQYLLTSHAGTPVAVWDRRRMNGPVHEVSHLPDELDPRLSGPGGLPLDPPDYHEPRTSQALHLSATSDILLGRADNGMCWLFDLSERLGWADGSHAGSWLSKGPVTEAAWHSGGSGFHGGAAAEGQGAEGDQDMSEGPAGRELEGGHLDEEEWERAPLPLGCVGAPYEAWCSTEGEAAPLHWLPLPAAWVAHNRLVALEGLELEQKQSLFPAHAQGSPYPSNAVAIATLCSGRG